jgi:PAS domain S-box-containing protein
MQNRRTVARISKPTEVSLRFSRFPEENLRLFVLLAALVVIVGGAWLLRQKMQDDSVDALRWVSHTHEVRAAVFDLTSSLNEMQASALAIKLEHVPAGYPGRYRAARARYGPALDHLRDLTRDSAVQQERIGMLRARVEQRVVLFDGAMNGDAGVVGTTQDLATAVLRYPIADISAAILAHEGNLVAQRQKVANRSVRYGRWVTGVTALAQILLLGGLIVLSERQMRRRVTAETDTRHAIERARLIVETVREPIAVIAADLGLLHVNRAFAQFYGLVRPVTGRLDEIPAWSDQGLHQRLKDVLTMQRELWDYETVQRTADETTRNVVVSARPMKLPDSAVATALLTVSDLTARKKGEEQVLELNRQLSGKVAQVTEVNRELEAFSYSVSHDLRAPLRHISGFSDKLRALVGGDGNEKAAHYCDVIAEASGRMAALIEDLLRYSRLGRHALRLQAVDMQSLVDEVRSTLMSSVDERVITWRIAPLPVVIADSSLMRLAWQNLLENAIKYTGDRMEALIEIGVDDSGDTDRVFWIRDNGVGFDMKYVDKLFGVFQRLHKASDFAGTGIGLASVRRIIARHDGNTWAEGTTGEGATFFFSLPRHTSVD